MKNKFLLMAMVTALFAVVLIPSALAVDTEVSTSVGGGSFSLTASGDYGTGSISLSALGTPPVTDTSSTYAATAAADYFTLDDSTSTDGVRVQVKASSSSAGDFVYSGSSGSQGNIDVSNFKLVSNFDSVSATYQSATKTTNYAATDFTLAISATATAASAQNLSASYFFHADLLSSPYYMTMSSGAQNYLTSFAAAPMLGDVRLDRLVLDIAGGSNAGSYTSTLVFTAVDGAT